MLLFLILSTLFSSSTAQPRPPAGLIANLAGDAAQAIPEGSVPILIPEEIITNNISPYMGFDEAMRTKNTFGWTDDQLVRQFSKQEPERVKNYIFRELNNPTIDDATRLRHLDILLNENPGLKFRHADLWQAATIGHAEIVTRILDIQPGLTLHAARASIVGDQFHLFQIVIGRKESLDSINHMLNFAIYKNAIPFVEYGINRIRALSPQMFAGGWYIQLVSNYIKIGRSLQMLEYLLRQPEWNPGTIRNLLDMMLLCFGNHDFTTRLGREFLNPRLSYQGVDGIQIIGGTETLDAAILQADAAPNYFIFDLDVVLRSIRDGDPT